ncbi:hypothetical protein K7J14_01315 [Treponema zuelzerae]|uniref:Uncharacterized protein n=1 Tax=Teretinema zuelzerae TaxID=156 RepID=A0AAE3JHS8_9SPIR|nr:hypothetical protein [Teretinema zuelzerae]MCD1653336.1 hypothetical protein [Teretinema zuelzerae]
MKIRLSLRQPGLSKNRVPDEADTAHQDAVFLCPQILGAVISSRFLHTGYM